LARSLSLFFCSLFHAAAAAFVYRKSIMIRLEVSDWVFVCVWFNGHVEKWHEIENALEKITVKILKILKTLQTVF
jgi:hypothetical protein